MKPDKLAFAIDTALYSGPFMSYVAALRFQVDVESGVAEPLSYGSQV